MLASRCYSVLEKDSARVGRQIQAENTVQAASDEIKARLKVVI